MTLYRRSAPSTLWLAAALLVLPAAGVAAQPGQKPQGLQGLQQNRNGPINIVSDSLELRDKDRTATFIDNVRLVQGDTVLECKRLVVYYDEKSKGKTTRSAGPPMAQGGGDQQISRLEAKGGVILTQKDQTAVGDNGVFDMKTNTMTLSGNVVLTQGPNVIRGDRLLVDMNTNVSRVQSDKGVQSVFLPNSPETKKPGAETAPPSASPNAGTTSGPNANAAKDKQKPSPPRPKNVN